MTQLSKFSFGIGDRFAHQAAAQLRAFQRLAAEGPVVAPVWNKSNREHTFIGSEPASVRRAAEAAVAQLGWEHPWHVDADHIRLETVDRFLGSSDFFTLDVANYIGKAAPETEIEAFIDRHPELTDERLMIPGIDAPVGMSRPVLHRIAQQYLLATQEAGRIYRHILAHRVSDASPIIEVSIDETPSAQSPAELLVILAGLSDQELPLQTIAPKFTGRFNKGVDYVGDLTRFEAELHQCLNILRWAVAHYGFPSQLKLSVHSGSDKFSLYPVLARALQATGAGLHVKTAGTTWLEETIGLCESGGEGLAMIRDIYAEALGHRAELCEPYADVIDIDASRLPSVDEVSTWDCQQLAAAIRHEPSCPDFNPSLRQLLHVSFKLAAHRGAAYLSLLEKHADVVGQSVEDNLYRRHLKPIFGSL